MLLQNQTVIAEMFSVTGSLELKISPNIIKRRRLWKTFGVFAIIVENYVENLLFLWKTQSVLCEKGFSIPFSISVNPEISFPENVAMRARTIRRAMLRITAPGFPDLV